MELRHTRFKKKPQTALKQAEPHRTPEKEHQKQGYLMAPRAIKPHKKLNKQSISKPALVYFQSRKTNLKISAKKAIK